MVSLACSHLFFPSFLGGWRGGGWGFLRFWKSLNVLKKKKKMHVRKKLFQGLQLSKNLGPFGGGIVDGNQV